MTASLTFLLADSWKAANYSANTMQYNRKNGKYSNFLDAVFACVASRFIVIRVKLRQHYENKVSFPKTQQNDLGQDLNLASSIWTPSAKH